MKWDQVVENRNGGGGMMGFLIISGEIQVLSLKYIVEMKQGR